MGVSNPGYVVYTIYGNASWAVVKKAITCHEVYEYSYKDIHERRLPCMCQLCHGMMHLFSALACAERIGVIGTDLDQQYGTRIPPGQSPAKGRFFLNTLDPATASGTVSSLRFCAYLNDDASVEIYQATIGFFRETGQHGQYDLLNSVGVAVNATPGLEYTCLSVSTPDIDVQVGDVIGVCSRTFNSSVASLGIAVSVDDDTSSLLRNGRMQRESLCPAVGSIPTNIAADQLETRSLLLPIYANISELLCNLIQPQHIYPQDLIIQIPLE